MFFFHLFFESDCAPRDLHVHTVSFPTRRSSDLRYYQKYSDAGLGEKEARYASMIEGMDKSLGDVMDYLEENDLADNTVLLFMSDNGGLSMVPPMGDRKSTRLNSSH